MQATLHDVAKLAGVSIATASRALSVASDRPVAAATQEKVRQAAQHLQYAPHDAAQRLVRGVANEPRRTFSVGLILNEQSAQLFSDPFWSRAIDGVHQELLRQEYHLGFALLSEALENGRQRRLLSRSYVDGLIIIGPFYPPAATIGHDRVVLIEPGDARVFEPTPLETDVVTMEKSTAMTRLVEYLIALGHRRFAYLGGTGGADGGPGEPRALAVARALTRHGLPLDPDLYGETPWTAEQAYDAAAALLARDPVPDALVCASDALAIAALRAARNRGLRVPDDLSITGFDDIALAREVDPPLTTVHVPKEMLGAVAVRKLMERIARPDLPPIIQVVPTTLAIRASSGPRHGGNSAATTIDEGR